MRTPFVLTAALLLASPVAAQEPEAAFAGGPELVDRVVAVVGDTVLLLSDVQIEMQQLEASGRPLPSDPVAREQFALQILEAKVEEMVLLEAARNAGIEVNPGELDDLVEQEIQAVRRRFNNSDVALETALQRSGITLAQYRQQIRGQYHDQRLREMFLQQRLRNRARPLVSEEQIRELFEAQRASLGTRPATVSMQQVIVKPEATPEAKAAARKEAEQVVQELAAGGDFEVLAKRFSDDPGSREHGGSLGWFKAGRMVPEFERVAFALRPGQTSLVVETEFGYHIIRVDKVRGPERQARHILIAPEITDADRQRARERADSVAAAIRGGASVAALARQYDTPAAEAEVARIPLERLPPAYEAALGEAGAGAVVGPFELESPQGAAWAVVRVVDRQAAGEYTLDDVREQVRARLQEQEMVEQLVEELRREIYVSIQA